MLLEAAALRKASEYDMMMRAAWLSGIVSQSAKPPKIEELLIEQSMRNEMDNPPMDEDELQIRKNMELLAGLMSIPGMQVSVSDTTPTVSDD